MATNNISVSLDFFKKYTYHEEWVDFMLKFKANGNQHIYEALRKSKQSQECALRCYYEAFYLKPKIREKYHIRVKPAPKKIKDKLLSIPVEKACTSNETSEKGENTNNKDDMQDVLKGIECNIENIALYKGTIRKGQSLLATQDVCEDCDYIGEDDKEPVSSPDVSSTLKDGNEYVKSYGEIQKVTEAFDDRNVPSETAIEQVISKENLKNSCGMQQNDDNTASVSHPKTTIKKASFNYGNLLPYVHCCPLTFKEFRKYSNINDLVREFAAKQKLDPNQERLVLQRCYMLFYLVPEHRKTTPVDKIQLLDNCPINIKEKFFTTPTTLYLKDNCDVENTEKNVTTSETDLNKRINNLKEQPIEPVDLHEQKKTTAESKTTDFVKVPLQVTSYDFTTATTDSNGSKTNCNNSIQQEIHQTAYTSENKTLINLSVSLEEFKKYTHYREIVETLFKIRAQNNNELLLKYKSSQTAFDNTLRNYYHAFYLMPVIRKIWPVRLKLMDNSFKTRLLSIPQGVTVTEFSNIKIEDLVPPEFTVSAVYEKDLSNAKAVPQPVEKMSTEVHAPIESAICITSSTNCTNTITIPTTTTTTTVCQTENYIGNSNIKKRSPPPLGGNKRSDNAIVETSSPKRQKLQELADSNQSKNTEKLYISLMPYAHCCPISFSDFRKYTNINELFSGYCQKRYNNIDKLVVILKRAYLLYYLMPENRNLKPLDKLKVVAECPLNLKNKIFQIPTKYLKTEQNRLVNEEKRNNYAETINRIEVPEELGTQNVTVTTNEHHTCKTSVNTRKEAIEILENRLLPPPVLETACQSNLESLQCSNNTCVFHHISCFEFVKLTNVLSIVPEAHETTVLQNIFKKFIYEIVKEQSCDEKYVTNSALLCKLLKYNKICAKCENYIEILSNLHTKNLSSASESDRLSKETTESVIEKAVLNNDSSKTNETVSLSDNIPTQPLITSKQPKDLWKFLRTDKIFSNFCQKLLLKLKQSFDATMDFSSDIYKMFFQCNEIPLREILRDFCENNEDIVERILNQLELNEALQRYYYVKYLTNERFALKYPVKLKTTNSMEVLHISEESNKDELKKDESNCTNFEKTNITNAIKISDGQKVYNVPLSQGKKPMNNALEKAKRIFFRTVQKTNTLNYVLRTSFEGKQVILRTVLSLTFEEFLALTNVYEGDGLYDDNHIAECMYRYVFYNPMVWPTNLYIKLKDLCEFLFKKNIRFDNYSTMLVNISPKLLHWSALLSCTDFVNCVQFDYEKRTGKLLDTYDIKHLKEECIDYYDRCWKYDKWLGQVPLLCDEFCNNLPNDNNADDATTMLHESETTRDGGAANIELANVETTTELDNCATTDPEAPEFNCVLLPNTQQQIAMLPAEEDITDDPLNNSNNGTNLRVSSSENCGILQNIKTEPIDNEFLFNLLFFEDENGTIQCLSHEEEIIDLDNTLSTPAFEETLPPSQVDFGEAVLELSPSRVLVNSDSTSTSLSLAQKIPSSIEYGDNTICTQQFIQSPQSDRFTPTQQIQFPDINLFNSDEIEIHENVPENSQVLNVIDVMQKKKNICLQNSPSTATDSHISTRNLVAESDLGEEKSSECAKEIMDCVLASVGEQQPTNRAAKQNVGGCKINYPSGIFKPGLPIRTYQGIMQKKATTKRSNNIATVKPLKNTDLVPQIQHTIRPLQTIQAYSTDNPALRPVPQILAPTSLMLNLTPPSCDEASTGQSIGPNSNIQLQLSNLRGHIYISQELNNNCSVFDNTSLLRVIDHNYHKHASTNLSSSRITHSGSSESSQNSGIVEVEHHQLPTVITTNQASDQMGPVNNTLENNLKDTNENDSISQKANEEHDTCDSLLIATTTSANEQKSSARIVTFSTSRLYNTSDEVNNIILTHTNNIVASVKFTFYQPRGNFQNIIRKPCLYRNLIKLHYFKELTSQHIAKYLLPSLEIGKSYSEALVTCDNFRTRISNRSISVLFPFWSKNIQRDFLLVLRDLKEFHYNVYDRATMYNHEDLRARILYSLLHTAPAFSLCQFVYDINNSEFSYCEAINNGNNPSYKRKPFESLTNALSPNILGKLKQMKAELNSK